MFDFLNLLDGDAPKAGVAAAGFGDVAKAAGPADFLSLLEDDAPRLAVAAAGSEALAIPTSAPVALSPLGVAKSAPIGAKTWVGAGRHGSKLERSMLTSHMRARKAELGVRKMKARLKEVTKQLILYLPGASDQANCSRQVTAQTMLDIGFSCRGRTHALAEKHSISKPWVMALRLYIIAAIV